MTPTLSRGLARAAALAVVVLGLAALPAALAATGDLLAQLAPGGDSVRGLAFDGGQFYLTRVGDDRLYTMARNGTITGSVGLDAAWSGEVWGPS